MSVVVSTTGADRWRYGHPWIYRSDVAKEPGDAPGIVPVSDRRGRFLGQALYSPKSEIRLRLLTRDPAPITANWWRDRIAEALAARERITASAYRVVHAEGDGLPSLVVDRYGPYAVAQLLPARLGRAAPKTAGSTASRTLAGGKPTLSICCAPSSGAASSSTRWCSIPPLSRRPRPACPAPSRATKRSTSGRCGCSRPAACCSPAPARSTCTASRL